MTIQEAIIRIKEFGLYHAIGDLPHSAYTVEAFDMAIKALEHQEKNRWIPVTERMPKEHKSIFAKLKGTDAWCGSMFERSSADVNVTTEFLDGTRTVETLSTIDGKWNERELKYPERKVIAWMPFPEPYKGERNETD